MKPLLALFLLNFAALGQEPSANPVPQPAPDKSSRNAAQEGAQKENGPPSTLINRNVPPSSPVGATGVIANAALIGGIVGAVCVLLGVVANIVANHFASKAARKHEVQKHIRELSVQLAIEQWKREVEFRDKEAAHNRETGKPWSVDFGAGGLQQAVMQMVAFASSLGDENSIAAIRNSVATQYERQRQALEAFNKANPPKKRGTDA